MGMPPRAGFGALLAVAACTEIQYVAATESPAYVPLVRTVGLAIDPAFSGRPACILVFPPLTGPGNKELGPLVGQSLVRHLRGRADRVLEAETIAGVEDLLAPDPGDSGAAQQFAVRKDCDSYLVTAVAGERASALIVWSELRIAVDARLLRARDGRELWRGQHVAVRSAGGLPLSLPGFLMSSVSAVRISMDRDTVESLVDDAVRRLVAALPE